MPKQAIYEEGYTERADMGGAHVRAAAMVFRILQRCVSSAMKDQYSDHLRRMTGHGER